MTTQADTSSALDHGQRSTPLHSVSVAGAVLDRDGRVLTIQRADNGAWEAPGGVLELGESPQDGVRREIFEETGIQVEVGGLTGVYKNMVRNTVTLFFLCTPCGGRERTSEETTRVAWLPPDDAAARMRPAHAIRIKDALTADGPHVRVHDGQQLIETESRV